MFQKYSGMDIFYAEKEISLFAVATFISHSAEELREGN